jgi:hypothetical protein
MMSQGTFTQYFIKFVHLYDPVSRIKIRIYFTGECPFLSVYLDEMDSAGFNCASDFNNCQFFASRCIKAVQQVFEESSGWVQRR